MRPLHVVAYIGLAGAHRAVANASLGLWKVACGDTMLDAIDKLGLAGYQPILDLTGPTTNFVQAGESYTVPFGPAASPATWITIAGNTILELRLNRTQGCPTITKEHIATSHFTVANLSSISISHASTTAQREATRMTTLSSLFPEQPTTVPPTLTFTTEGDTTGPLDKSSSSLTNACSDSIGSPRVFQGLNCHQRRDWIAASESQTGYAVRFCQQYY